jgi:hypothetical protein
MRAAFAGLLLVACSHERPKPIDVSKLPPLPRSSIAAVIEHRSALALSDDQVDRLRELDDQRARTDQEISTKTGEHKEPPARQTTAGGSGRSMGGGRMGGTGMGRRGGGGFTRRGASGDSGRTPRTLQDRLDDNDTNSYLDAEENVLLPSQRPPAREIAEDFREQLYGRRELLRKARESQ